MDKYKGKKAWISKFIFGCNEADQRARPCLARGTGRPPCAPRCPDGTAAATVIPAHPVAALVAATALRAAVQAVQVEAAAAAVVVATKIIEHLIIILIIIIIFVILLYYLFLIVVIIHIIFINIQ
ncbi:hypothetical protein scyTo_0003982 [Scyliorhinus torazame]|uniref:Uncharacterized protein n=1 Tax=Scyliorhinus torazame TaxID=75743 RepID=A0A401NII1_SCYTO|nr:hypothetical protein [Scyliorhinus torazame]